MSMIVWPFVALAFSTWAVSLGGIASLQQDCTDGVGGVTSYLAGINGFSGYYDLTDPSSSVGATCKTVYRFYWFIVALEFVVILIISGFLASGFFAKSRMAAVGLLSVVTLLYISMTDTFLSAGSAPPFYGDTPRTRERVMLAGSLMTATANCFLIIVCGIDLEMIAVQEVTREVVAEKAVV